MLSILVYFKQIEVPKLSYALFREIAPISLMFLGNIISGLYGTRGLSLPMFTAIRRFSIPMTMLTEWAVLSTTPNLTMIYSVITMVGGGFIAALYDISYDTLSYVMVMANNTFTALNGVYMKKALVSNTLKSNKLGVLYYNSLFSAIMMVLFYIGEDIASGMYNKDLAVKFVDNYGTNGVAMMEAHAPSGTGGSSGIIGGSVSRRLLSALTTTTGSHTIDVSMKMVPHELVWASTLSKISEYDMLQHWTFLPLFFACGFLGSVLNYSIFLCTTYNSALTTAVIGCLKNIATSYLGMMLFSDYLFTIPNFLGINISIVGSLYYTYVVLILNQGSQGKTAVRTVADKDKEREGVADKV